ncbi:MAG: hypothetical protein U9R60_09635, partial [Bacteroidota bacterium]|nr:hypothetical protein [Bacteroidota bacterium]
MRQVKKGSTDQSVVVRVIDSTSGLPETGVAYNTAGAALWYRKEGGSKTSITLATLAATNSAHSDGGFIHVGDGYCRLDLPDAAVASGANGVIIGGTFTDMVVIGTYVPLVDFDPYDSVRMGQTALPNAAADAAGGLPISDAGGLDLDDIPITSEFNARTLPSADYVVTTDTIAGVTLVTTCTTNTDMRGTDLANTTTPPTVGEIRTEMESAGNTLDAVVTDTNDLQTNQSNWLTATGFAVPNEYTESIEDIKATLGNGGDTFYVSKSGNNSDGTTWAKAKTTIDAAIALCTANHSDRIYVAAGTYDETSTTSGVTCDVE